MPKTISLKPQRVWISFPEEDKWTWDGSSDLIMSTSEVEVENVMQVQDFFKLEIDSVNFIEENFSNSSEKKRENLLVFKEGLASCLMPLNSPVV